MALIKRNDVYWMDVMINGVRHRQSLKTGDKKMAEELHDIKRAELWRVGVLKEKPKKTFADACERWLTERSHKTTIGDDKDKMEFLRPKLAHKLLTELDRDIIEGALPQDVKPATRNRYRAMIRAVLRACEREWEWLDKAPILRTEPEPRRRVAFLSREQAESLIASLPERYRMPVRFALLTGLRRANVFGLRWENVNLDKSVVVVHADEAKAREMIVVPLNSQAKALLEALPQPRQGRVWGDMDRVWANTWESACKRAGVPGFRFHDLRHTWASWHAMAGTPMNVLMELGGWASPAMLRKYAHLSPEHLASAAERVTI